MKSRYNDPYELPQEIIVPDGDPEALQEILDFLNEDARLIQNAERRERYHTPYHLEALDYEGGSVAYHDTPERIVIRKEEAEHIRETLVQLPETQRRRLLMLDEEADTGHLVELHRRGRYPGRAGRAKRNGIAYMIVSYAVFFFRHPSSLSECGLESVLFIN